MRNTDGNLPALRILYPPSMLAKSPWGELWRARELVYDPNRQEGPF